MKIRAISASASRGLFGHKPQSSNHCVDILFSFGVPDEAKTETKKSGTELCFVAGDRVKKRGPRSLCLIFLNHFTVPVELSSPGRFKSRLKHRRTSPKPRRRVLLVAQHPFHAPPRWIVVNRGFEGAAAPAPHACMFQQHSALLHCSDI